MEGIKTGGGWRGLRQVVGGESWKNFFRASRQINKNKLK